MMMIICTSTLILLSIKSKNWWTIMCWSTIITFFFILKVPSLPFLHLLNNLLSLDSISSPLILLSLWISTLMILASNLIKQTNLYPKLFLLITSSLLLFLMLTFMLTNMVLFYLTFEASLVPTLLLILGWGYQPERTQAGMYLMLYTLLASLPLLISIMFLITYNNSLIIWMNWYQMNNNNNLLLYLGMILAFLVKMPMFLTHLWLPKAHVEAPISGSMILAGVLLKLGGYGLLRVLKWITPIALKANPTWISISLIGAILISITCLRQTDLKSLIAYSSVAHMAIALSGIMTLTHWGLMGSLSMMIAHGLTSSGLFFLANIMYERTGSRSLLINRGMTNLMPSTTLWWFLLSASNMAAPPSLNLLAEITLINAIMTWSNTTMWFLILISFFSAAYTLYLFTFTQQGKPMTTYAAYSTSLREFLVLILHWTPLNLILLTNNSYSMWL